MILGLVLAACGWLVWTLRLGGLVRRAGRRDPAPDRPRAVSVVVPARDEAHNLPALLASLRALAPAQTIVVDDHSTDGTGEVARGFGAEVVVPEPLPPGWVGKPWACRRGAAAARGEAILFTDADTVHGPGSLDRAVARLDATGADLVSIVPTHATVAWWEQLQGAFQLLLLVATRGGRDFAIGQYLLFRRGAYDALGGHDPVRDRIAEDLALMRAVRARGGRYELVLAPGALRVRMYPEGLRGFVRGWRRNFREGLGESGVLGVVEIALVYAWLVGLPLLALGGAWLAGAVWLVSLADVARRQRLVGDFPAWTALAAPVALAVFAWCTAAAVFDHARGAPVTWRGRRIPAPRWRVLASQRGRGVRPDRRRARRPRRARSRRVDGARARVHRFGA